MYIKTQSLKMIFQLVLSYTYIYKYIYNMSLKDKEIQIYFGVSCVYLRTHQPND